MRMGLDTGTDRMRVDLAVKHYASPSVPAPPPFSALHTKQFMKPSHELFVFSSHFVLSCHSVFSLSPRVAVPRPAATGISDILQQEENPILNVNCNLLIQTNESRLDNQ